MSLPYGHFDLVAPLLDVCECLAEEEIMKFDNFPGFWPDLSGSVVFDPGTMPRFRQLVSYRVDDPWHCG